MKDQTYFLKKAEENRPFLFTKKLSPKSDKTHFQTGDSIVLDLGDHCVGHFSFQADIADIFFTAPVGLIIRFGENLQELEDDYSKYHGNLAKTWFQEERVIIDYPMEVKIARRYSCRYIKITVEETRRTVVLSDFSFVATTSADQTKLSSYKTEDSLLQEIDRVSAATLRECMQTFFEDGPKRDRRLWIGDLRLEALTNYYTYQNLEIVKRCLYLFAAGKCNALGFVPSFIYETPKFYSGSSFIADYALLYVVTLCDYFEHTGDKETVFDLLELCKSQLNSFENILDEDLIVIPQKGWFFFIDWCPELRGYTALQGVYLYTLDRFSQLLEKIGDDECERYRNLLCRVRAASRKKLFNEKEGVFQNALDNQQKSVHSQVWMILGGAIKGEEAERALRLTLEDATAKKPVTPYMWHYVIDAMFDIGMREEGLKIIKDFWGGMIARGADTFFEVYVPEDPEFSPYEDRMVNSLCHAWSCTPAYFIRKYTL